MLVYNSSWKFGYVFFQLGGLKWNADWALGEGGTSLAEAPQLTLKRETEANA